MRAADRFRLFFAILAVVALAGCAGDSVSTETAPPAQAAPARETYPDPPPAVADEVTEQIRVWLAERLDAEGSFDIPPRGGRDVAGTMAELHTVHQNDADTYTICVDFVNGDETYDVDFFVDRTPEGLQVRDVYLHKINDEVVSG